MISHKSYCVAEKNDWNFFKLLEYRIPLADFNKTVLSAQNEEVIQQGRNFIGAG